MMIASLFSNVYRYRGFVIGSVKREFASRYRNSMLGAAWLVLQPLAQILVFTLIFSQVMQARLAGVSGAFSYGIFLCAGSLTWGLFAEIVGRGQNVFLDNANLIKKLNFPRICLPVTVVVAAFLNFAIIFSLFTAFLIFSGSFPGWVYFAVFPLLLLQMLFAIGLGMVLGVLNVFFRDVGQLFAIILQFWYWLTPIVYPIEALPVWARSILAYNPMTCIITGYQDILLKGILPVWTGLLPTALIALLFCMAGLSLFKRHAGDMVDEL